MSDLLDQLESGVWSLFVQEMKKKNKKILKESKSIIHEDDCNSQWKGGICNCNQKFKREK